MASETPVPSAAGGIPSVKVIQDIPVLFADGVLSHAYGPGVAKFYFYRTDSSPDPLEGTKNVPVLQIVMPAHGFAALVHFFQHRLNLMIQNGAISAEAVNKIKETIYPVAGPTNAPGS